jgi:hypothetical protein
MQIILPLDGLFCHQLVVSHFAYLVEAGAFRPPKQNQLNQGFSLMSLTLRGYTGCAFDLYGPWACSLLVYGWQIEHRRVAA